MNRTLLVIDIQNDYFPGGLLPLWQAEETEARIVDAISSVVRTSTPELNLQRIDAIFAAREQMLEFNVPPALALEAMMVALQAPHRQDYSR